MRRSELFKHVFAAYRARLASSATGAGILRTESTSCAAQDVLRGQLYRFLPSSNPGTLGFPRGISSCATAKPDSSKRLISAVRLGTAHSSNLPPLFGNSWRSVASLPPVGSLPNSIRYSLYGLLLLTCAVGTYYGTPWSRTQEDESITSKEEETVTNWSNTHEAHPRYYHHPETLYDLERIVKLGHVTTRTIRPTGSGLSPNGLGFSNEGMVNMALMDKVLVVDATKKQITVQAGARIDQVVEALKPHGLTLENYASIKEQQVGGFIQVGAHGTGAAIPPGDERVVKMKVVTPTRGTIELSEESDPELFHLARCGLGTLGIVAEVTLQCVPAHKLVEQTLVSNMKEVRKNHKKWLQQNRHLRYMWIPYTDVVVVIQSNPLLEGQEPPTEKEKDDAGKIKSMMDVYNDMVRKRGQPETKSEMPPKVNAMAGIWSGTAAGSKGSTGTVYQEAMTFPAMRDRVLAFAPLDPEHVKRVNKAEATYWRRNTGYRVGWSHEILSFDCGGQQWVSEVCFPAGTVDEPDMSDIKFMEELLELIRKRNIPAPGPIEQRWTSSSRSSMSPASDPSPDRLFSWVGIIMYLPTEDPAQRQAITESFFDYRGAVQKNLWDPYGAYEHWAKVEIRDKEEAEWSRERLKKRFPVDSFVKAQIEIDPRGIFTNELIETLFPKYRHVQTQ
ncbi:L-galactono-1,4-lactone dehydrogenase 1, mitochondrial [Selaginella moellendorffii]|uniref:L-galactono-1,4-lactone dehydrogenase 1, mitochondrial n=1 Tax=Selaginella moellendorffii TaxID=88036 RepID=UPI000D1CF8F9|nr:L-galactono-1,4-lactone dehydrogenase 1, mitochondrial [Selaginella moellendorffii]XP_024533818.1 L-galactono-1,4-lactone dehydrogenase 1, mitochondrial [Selaginella moellendorffii]XP_024533819.1 L-galactono-1,4-lactone dehydrogenase 1, mitochondrial [Selaginella moellendorffii]|eukprot:XP_024533817.1 L-galactono-1,4-lactone dehydrogenase 1, mitochondrial [Selaginella moellendorffii]